MTRKRRVLAAKIAVILATIPALIYGFSTGPLPGLTGAPGESNCTQCHGSFPLITNAGGISLQLPGEAVYRPGQTQRWTVDVFYSDAVFYGFELSVRDSSNGQAGDLKPISGATQVKTQAGIQYIEHTMPDGGGQFTFEWTPPSSDIGEVKVYIAANAANANGGTTGDQILLRNFTLQPAPALSPKPVLAAANPVVNGASFTPGISSGSWVTIFGTDLAPATRTWNPETEIINGALPTELDGVSVTINGKPAAVYYISPTQLNVQAPDDESVGPVQVEVIRDGVSSGPVIAELQAHAPAFFLFDQGGRKYAAAVHSELDEGRVIFVGPDGLFGETQRSRRVKAGDVIMLFGTGFGPTDPPVPAGQVFEGVANLAGPVTIRFGSVVADDVQFAGLSGAGVYQFNIRIPNGLPEGDVPLIAELAGLRSQEGVFIAVDD